MLLKQNTCTLGDTLTAGKMKDFHCLQMFVDYGGKKETANRGHLKCIARESKILYVTTVKM